MKKYLVLSFSVLIILCCYKVCTFNIFDDEISMLKEYHLSNKNYHIRIYYIPSNATTQSVIQIRKFSNDIEEVLKSYEKYNELNENYIKSDTLILNISDKNKVVPSKQIKFFLK